jgi:hypothetical protein
MWKEYLAIPMPRRLRRGGLRQKSFSKQHTKRLYHWASIANHSIAGCRFPRGGFSSITRCSVNRTSPVESRQPQTRERGVGGSSTERLKVLSRFWDRTTSTFRACESLNCSRALRAILTTLTQGSGGFSAGTCETNRLDNFQGLPCVFGVPWLMSAVATAWVSYT